MTVAIEPGINTLDEYANNVIMKIGEDARTLVLMLIPMLFRCRIKINVLDTDVRLGKIA